MLTNQDRRAILEQVKTSGSGDIISALRGQVISESPQQQIPIPQAVDLPPASPPPVQNVSMDTIPSTISSLVDSSSNTSPQIQDLPTGSAEPQILKTGGYVQKYPHGGPHAPPVPENNAKIYPTEEKSWWDKTLNVLANPLAAFGRSVRGEDINPGNIPRGENAFDTFVLGMVNPASWAESGQYAVKEAKQGNYLASGLNALGVLPIVPAGIKGVSVLKNIGKTSKTVPRGIPTVVKHNNNIRRLQKERANISDNVYTPSSAEASKIKVIKDENIRYLKSDEYISKRMANTGESKESILSQIDDYIKELDETPISFETSEDIGKNILGYYKKGDPFENIPSKIAIEEPRTAYKFIDKDMFGTIDHEIKHLLSPAQKLDKTSPTYKLYNSPKFKEGRKKYLQAIDDINDKFMKATSKEEADRIISMYDKIPNKEIFDGTYTSKIPTMDKVYKNYPTLKIDSGKNTSKEFAEYLSKAREQQPRLLRGAQWVKDNFNWDGTKSGMTDNMLDNIFDQLQNSKNLGGKTKIPEDFRTLLENSTMYKSGVDDYRLIPDATYSKLKDVLSKAWATIPVGFGIGASEKKKGGFKYDTGGEKKVKKENTSLREHMMEYMNFSGRDTNKVNFVMDVIAEHESGNVDDKIQVSQNDDGTFYDGPGRGAYQFEIGDKKGANTAMNRTANFLASPANKTYFGSTKTIKDFTNIYEKYIASPSQDFSKLSRDDQDALFLGDKLYGGVERRNNFDKVLKNPTQENVFMYWLTDHKGKVNGKNIKDLTKEEIDIERKKWKSRTKNMFK